MAGTGIRDVLILEIDLVIQKRHDQTRRRTRSPALLPLIAANWIIAVKRALALLVQSSQNRMHVVGKEALAVEDVTQSLGACGDAHGLAVLVLVHLDNGVES